MHVFRFALTLAAGFALASQGFADWPTFRGPGRTGVAPDTGLLKKWPEEGPKLVWEAKGAGRGYASPAIAQGKLITIGDTLSGADDKDEYLTCFDLKSGELLWKSKTGAQYKEQRMDDWNSPRSTPTIDGEHVYVITPGGALICCQVADGKEVWRKDLKKEFGGGKADGWGYSESPTVDGDWVLCTPGKEKATMVALNKKTGDTIWTAARSGDTGAGHASIVISNAGGVKTYVNTTGSGVFGVRASDGKVMWTHDFGARITAVIPTVILKEDFIFVPVGYKKGGALLKQVPGDAGEMKVEEVYGFQTKLANKHGGVVLIGDYVYGDSDDSGNPYCAEVKTGAIKWTERGPAGRGSIAVTAADGCLYMRCQDGTMALVEASPEAYKVLSTFKIPGSGKRPSWSHPVIDNGKLYLREGDSILCYDIKA
jgi:outer membrane protein assembly factor BamB